MLPVNTPKRKPRPRLTHAVADGLRTVHSDAQAMLEERGGWNEDHPTDENETLALEYLDNLMEWYWARRAR